MPTCRPYGFLERFDPDFTPNTTDLSGRRYSYRNQTMIGHWNIAQLANAFITGGLLEVVGVHMAFLDFLSVALSGRTNSPAVWLSF